MERVSRRCDTFSSRRSGALVASAARAQSHLGESPRG